VLLKTAKVGPYRSMNKQQVVNIDADVTVFVGMNEAGKTVLLKALHRSEDALGTDKFDPVEDYPRKDLSAYLKVHKEKPAVACELIYELGSSEIKSMNAQFGCNIQIGQLLGINHLYSNGRTISLYVDEKSCVAKFASELGTDAAAAIKGCTKLRQIPSALKEVELTDAEQSAVTKLEGRIQATDWENIVAHEIYQALKPSIPKFLYFSDYDVLPGKMNLADLAARVEAAKSDPKQLKSSHRAVLALLRMAEVTLEELATPGGYEELKSKIEGVSISLTDQVMEFWKQNEDLEVEVDIKADGKEEAPFNNGPNLYLRIKNRRHRGVSTSFDQRSRGFIWFFSFLVWFDSVQHQLDAAGKNLGNRLILLLDEPGLALHALAQADFLRYIDKLAESHQVLYTTHSPFMVHSDRLHQVRLVEDRKTDGTVITDNLSSTDQRTIFPLQAALGWTIAQNLFISECNLLVEGPSELVYLKFASAVLEASGGGGLREDITIVPTGGLDNLATFVSLLGASGLKLAVLHDYRGSPEQKMAHLVREKLLAKKALFDVSQFREPTTKGASGKASDVEDLFTVPLYLKYFNMTFATQLGDGNAVEEAALPEGDRIVNRIERYLEDKKITLRPSGGYNHYLVANKLAANPPKTLDAATLARFRALFTAVNGAIGSE
jgi:hypothetical protein